MPGRAGSTASGGAAPPSLAQPAEGGEQHRPGSGRLIVVSNRLPVDITRTPDGEFQYRRASGGLVPAVQGASVELGGMLWLGNPGPGAVVPEELVPDVEARLLKEGNCIPVWIDEETADEHYNGFSNAILWPLFHYKENIDFRPGAWEAYRKANEIFCQAVLKEYQPGDLLWVHDYHLMLLPMMLREAAAAQGMESISIGFFLHIPFPTSEVYRCIPWREDLLRGVLAADIVGFHSYDYAQHFCSACQRLLGLQSEPGEVEFQGRVVRVGVFPVGLNFDKIQLGLAEQSVRDKILELRRRFDGQHVLIGVDRLDYIKGIPHKLQALERVFEDNPSRVGNLVLIQIAVPSREDVEEYQLLRREVETLVGRINARYSRQDSTVKKLHLKRPDTTKAPGFHYQGMVVVKVAQDGAAAAAGMVPGMRIMRISGVQVESESDIAERLDKAPAEVTIEVRATRLLSPIYYIYNSVPFQDLLAMYSIADACLVTSLRDGMNLVCQEYIVCQRENNGVLVLSEFTGSARCLAGAVRVNPWNVAEVADAIERAVDMSPEERRDRHTKLYKYCASHGATHWGRTFLSEFTNAAQSARATLDSPTLSSDGIVADWRRGRKRLLVVALDGVLRENTPCGGRPAALSQRATDALRALWAQPGTTVVVYSGGAETAVDDALAELAATPPPPVSPITPGGETRGRLVLFAEHGYYCRVLRRELGGHDPQDDWHELGTAEGAGDRRDEWWTDASAVLESFSARTPGSVFDRERKATLAWSWRQADPLYGARQAQECYTHLHNRSCRTQDGLGEMGKGYRLVMDRAQGILEVLPKGLTMDYTLGELLPYLELSAQEGVDDSAFWSGPWLSGGSFISAVQGTGTVAPYDVCAVVGLPPPSDAFSCALLRREITRHCTVAGERREGQSSPNRGRRMPSAVLKTQALALRFIEQLAGRSHDGSSGFSGAVAIPHGGSCTAPSSGPGHSPGHSPGDHA
eukprot:TRINITY_DN60445_c0_g1_i1.p1 TRINITY_DN60445_c0_g1~~TRINITY_DN60445_c0_g1_i1.p1  ORF type:complete len:1003 (+),score=348.38 TRINITY_DN60445_c0_g1_i1:81-3011(+)